jgi:hypothetical protein
MFRVAQHLAEGRLGRSEIDQKVVYTNGNHSEEWAAECEAKGIKIITLPEEDWQTLKAFRKMLR